MKKGTFCMAAGLLLILGALLLTGYNLWDEQRAAQSVQKAVQAITESRHVTAMESQPDPDETMLAVEIDGKRYVGSIELPSLGIALPVLEDCSEENLKMAPCVYSGTVYKDGFILAGHNYKSHFGKINRLSVGDEAIFTDMEGNSFTYTVVEQTVINGNDSDAMAAGDWPLTLFTCTLDGQSRITVRFDRAQDNSEKMNSMMGK